MGTIYHALKRPFDLRCVTFVSRQHIFPLLRQCVQPISCQWMRSRTTTSPIVKIFESSRAYQASQLVGCQRQTPSKVYMNGIIFKQLKFIMTFSSFTCIFVLETSPTQWKKRRSLWLELVRGPSESSQAFDADIMEGPSGLSMLKTLREDGFTVTLYERRSDVGGLWALTGDTTVTSALPCETLALPIQ